MQLIKLYIKLHSLNLPENFHLKNGQNDEKHDLFSNPEAVGLIKVQTLMDNDECAWTNTCGAFRGFLAFDNLLSSQDPLGLGRERRIKDGQKVRYRDECGAQVVLVGLIGNMY
ncbi:hypothetical protein RJT34_23919 [Clitoria ternatea]|uniref:Uncharacterized protein n=1 Tax=Clitoria ternatea TaxID=43366 RepID=A0AAN9FT58_CLITE